MLFPFGLIALSYCAKFSYIGVRTLGQGELLTPHTTYHFMPSQRPPSIAAAGDLTFEDICIDYVIAKGSLSEQEQGLFQSSSLQGFVVTGKDDKTGKLYFGKDLFIENSNGRRVSLSDPAMKNMDDKHMHFDGSIRSLAMHTPIGSETFGVHHQSDFGARQ